MGALALEAAQRLSSPATVDEWPVLVVAAVGIVINGVTAWLFLAGSKGDFNIRAAFLHMAADALVSLGVVISAAAVLATGWMWIDPAISLPIVTMVVWGTWSLFAQSLHLLFDGVPHGVDLAAVHARLRWSLDRMREELRERRQGVFLVSEHLAQMMVVQALRLRLQSCMLRLHGLGPCR